MELVVFSFEVHLVKRRQKTPPLHGISPVILIVAARSHRAFFQAAEDAATTQIQGK